MISDFLLCGCLQLGSTKKRKKHLIISRLLYQRHTVLRGFECSMRSSAGANSKEWMWEKQEATPL